MLSIPIVSPMFRMVMRIISIVVWALTALSAFGGKFNPEFFTIPAVLCLALPYLGILSIILTIFWAVTGRFFFTALGVLAIIACIGPMSQAMPISFPKKADDGQQTFKIMSWNVLHNQDLRKPDYPGNRPLEYMIDSEADIICLAEVNNFGREEMGNAPQQTIDSLFRIYPYRAGQTYSDIKILSKYPVERIETGRQKSGGQPRFDIFKVNMPGHILTVAMVHLYSYDLSEEERQVVTEIKSVNTAKSSVKELKGSILSKLRNAFRMRAQNAQDLREAIGNITGPLIVCGDFNDVPTSWTYNIVKGDDMHDAYAETNFGPTFTYNLHAFYFHIDQMLYRGPIEALDLEVGKINSSDHYPLIGEFAFTK
ncbi:MAG: endonuclease/exonuclease/phosphatase family protein [Muribaculaceae bacterium]|nr:endonuclease/exonuclease/phosphatase family protein [Muribaculaceae bacterium]